MSTPSAHAASRRKFLRFLAGSPLFACAGAAGLSLGARSRAWSAAAMRNMAPPTLASIIRDFVQRG